MTFSKNWSKYDVRVRIKGRGEIMAIRSYTPERVISKLMEAEILLSQAVAVSGVHVHAKSLGRTTCPHLHRF